jgi:hypothetical protein
VDKTKQPLAVVTMVYSDYPMLKRWYEYYGAQVGVENLFIFSHGNDPEHRRIAPGANILNAPRDETLTKFERRRWRMLSFLASGLLESYNWAMVVDVDEIVMVDPAITTSLVDHLSDRYGDPKTAPPSISPFGLNIIHVPEAEPDPIVDGEPILARRRHFIPTRAYSKPCLVREPVIFGPGGHRNNLGLRHLSDSLYLVHLKWADITWLTDRTDVQAALVSVAGKSNPDYEENGWTESVTIYHDIRSTHAIGEEDIALPEVRAAMLKQVERHKNQFIWGPLTDKTSAPRRLYKIPERFGTVF